MAVVDLSLAQTSDLDWLRELRRRCPDLKVIVLSVHDERSVRRAAMETGVDAFVLKRAIATDLLNAVDEVRTGVEAPDAPKSPAVVGTLDTKED
jgi:DNA-binding NarL/FixJ family response regulator